MKGEQKMDKNKFHEIRLQLLIHDLNCPDPNKMYYVELAERVRFTKGVLAKLYECLAADGNEDTIYEVMKDNQLYKETLEKYGISNKQPEPTAEEAEQNQVRCLRNIMDNFSVTAEQAMVLLEIDEAERDRYSTLLE